MSSTPLVTRRSSLVTASALALALLLSACDSSQTTLHAGLPEQQANRVMAALLDADIPCHKAPGDEGTWNVTVY